MKKRTHIIYIPGLGDGYDPFRRWSLKFWNIWGVSAELCPITWYDGGSIEQKMRLIAEAIEHANSNNIVLIGESAGATLALRSSTHPNVSRVITLCGVARPDTPIAQYLRRRAPALNSGVNEMSEAFDADIHCIRAWADSVVGRKYSVVKGAREHVVWSVGHFFTIALCLTIYSWWVARIASK